MFGSILFDELIIPYLGTRITNFYVYILTKFVSGNLLMKPSCGYCQKKFTRRHGLRRHIQEVHFVERTFKCDKCQKNFKRKYHLKQHLRSDCHDNSSNCEDSKSYL